MTARDAWGHEIATNLLIFAILAITTFEVYALEVAAIAAVAKANTNVKAKINLECKFGYTGDKENKVYACMVDNLNIRSGNIAVASFSGTHQNGKADEDVELIVFRSGTMFFIPSQIGQIFTNLKTLKVNKNLSTKRFERSDLQGLGKLVRLQIYGNDLTTLDYDSFRDIPLLESFTLVDNRLTEIDVRTFETNVNLKTVSLRGSKIEILPRNLFTNNLQLERVDLYDNSLKFIDKTTFERNNKLREVFLGSNKLEVLPSHLFTNNLLLELVNLAKNSLNAIDETTFQTNVKLRQIDLSKNRLEVLPSHLFTNNSLLQTISLYDNSLRIIDQTTFETNGQLKDLYLEMNKLEVLPSHLFANNLLLEYVDLHSNSLKIIDEVTFQMNVKLKRVNMEMNKLEVLPRHLFTNNLLLEEVALSNNLLKIIEIDFTALRSIKKIILYNNECIDAYFDGGDPKQYRRRYRNLTEFQNIITSNCNSSIQ